jgi:CRP-like cAMP-binding protein
MNSKIWPRFLKRVPLFSRLSSQDLATLARIAKAREVCKGEMIFSKADSGDALYVVVRGRVKIFSQSRMGKIKTFAYLEPRDFFGDMALLGESHRSAGAMAMDPSVLLTIRRADFQKLLVRRLELSFALLRALCARLSQADREIESLSFNSVLGRVAELLLGLAKRYGKKHGGGVRIGLKISHRELANRAGTAREMISRVLNRFVRTGCLEMNGEYLTLTNVEKLKGWIY